MRPTEPPAEFVERRLRLAVIARSSARGVRGYRFAGFSLLPAGSPPRTPGVRNGTQVWRPPNATAGWRSRVRRHYVDIGTPPDYLAANLHAAGVGSLIAPDAVVDGPVERSVVGAAARVYGSLENCVVFPGGYVGSDERLAEAVRVGRDVTVRVPRPG